MMEQLTKIKHRHAGRVTVMAKVSGATHEKVLPPAVPFIPITVHQPFPAVFGVGDGCCICLLFHGRGQNHDQGRSQRKSASLVRRLHLRGPLDAELKCMREIRFNLWPCPLHTSKRWVGSY